MISDRLQWINDGHPTAASEISRALNPAEKSEFEYHWGMQARREQSPPPGDWRIWLILAGRGFGKTRAGAEWVRDIAERCPDARIALVATTLSEARAIMVEGESGIIACSPPERRPVFEASLKRLRFPNGAQALIYSAQEPESLRGPQHSHARWAVAEGILCQSVLVGN
ncbi:MAG: terminase large subunit domain-containing protein [Erythrobacter sp.]